jgi:hypothetical protein
MNDFRIFRDSMVLVAPYLCSGSSGDSTSFSVYLDLTEEDAP